MGKKHRTLYIQLTLGTRVVVVGTWLVSRMGFVVGTELVFTVGYVVSDDCVISSGYMVTVG